MAIEDVNSSSLQAESQPKSAGLVWWLTVIRWSGWTVSNDWCHMTAPPVLVAKMHILFLANLTTPFERSVCAFIFIHCIHHIAYNYSWNEMSWIIATAAANTTELQNHLSIDVGAVFHETLNSLLKTTGSRQVQRTMFVSASNTRHQDTPILHMLLNCTTNTQLTLNCTMKVSHLHHYQ